MRSGEESGLAVCELCYHGASDQQIAACEMVPDPDNLEEKLIAEVEKKTGLPILAEDITPKYGAFSGMRTFFFK